MKQSLTIVHLYANEMNIYGDRGNILTLVKRLEWRGFGATVVEVGIGDEFDLLKADIIFAGGGQDRGQVAVGLDLQQRAEQIKQAVAAGVPILTICGTYQLFGKRFVTLDGEKIPGIGVFDAETMGSRKRMIGNIVISTTFGELVGFENHSGQTRLNSRKDAFGKIIKGFGNSGEDKTEGARVNDAFGTYLHGPILPKNPVFADYLILTALKNKYGIERLVPLDDKLELKAAESAKRRPQ
jgi:CobQ-like glutamine amidotransferase family enzyme